MDTFDLLGDLISLALSWRLYVGGLAGLAVGVLLAGGIDDSFGILTACAVAGFIAGGIWEWRAERDDR